MLCIGRYQYRYVNVVCFCVTRKEDCLYSVDMTRWVSTLCVTSCTRERNVLLDNMCDNCKVSRNKTRYVRAGYEQHPNEVTYIVSVPSTVSGESYADRSRRVVNVMEMIRRHNRPALWKHVVQQVVVNGRLEITNRALTETTLAGLTYVLKNCDMSGVTTLK